jgi:hypothetical protein
MKRKLKNIVVMSLTMFFSPSVLAGNLNSPATPSDAGSAMYTLEDIYNRLNDGTEGTKRNAFAESTAVPAATGKTLDDVMSKAPAKDNTNGAEPNDVATGKTYWGLTDGNWGLQTGTKSPPSCTKNSSANPVFTVNGDGTVTDNRTCLIWLQDASCADLAGTDSNGKANWNTAQTAASSLANGTCGLTDSSSAGDWRLPTAQELGSLVHYGYSSPALSNTTGDAKWTADEDGFSGVQMDKYWSSSIYASNPASAWYVNLNGGKVSSSNKAYRFYVWPVRGGQ